MLKLRIGQKLLLLILAVSLIPLAGVTFYLFYSAQDSLRTSAIEQQSILTSSAASRVNQFITDKINLLIIHSQSLGVQNFDLPTARQDFANLIKQDQTIETIALADKNGMERLALNSSDASPPLVNIGQTDAFRAATFLAEKEYISPVEYDSQKKPFITIAIPLVTFNTSQSLSDLSTAESGLIRGASAVKGALVVTVNLNDLWQSVLSQKLGADGYAYLVDSQGNLIAYPDASFLASHKNLSSNSQVAAFINNPDAKPSPSVTMSERGTQVLSSYQVVPRTGWGVIAEEPTVSIFAAANRIAKVGTTVFLAVTLLVIAASFIFSRRLTGPIERLAAGAALIAQGRLNTRVDDSRRDEVGGLGRAFNTMSASLSAMIRQAEAEATKLNLTLNNVGESIIAVDSSGKIMMANIAAAALAGELPKAMVGRQVTDIFDWSRDDHPLRPSLDKTEAYRDVSFTDAAKRIHYTDVLVNRINGDPSGIQAIFTIIDKTGERELENMKVDFVSMAAHELRTPMTAIRGYLELILGDPTPGRLDEETKARLGHIQSNSLQLVGLINNLLNVSRIERGALTLHLDKLNWAEIVQASVNDQRFTANIKSIRLLYDAPDKPIYILADKIAITEIINNLLSNAVNYTNEHGTVSVSIKDTPDGILTSVQDDGVGISPNAQQHLFTKFYRAREGLSSGSGGSGLGLFISRSIAELHGGTITVHSAVGEGSTFIVKLPHFDSEKFDEIIKTRPTNLHQSHGWTTKNITR